MTHRRDADADEKSIRQEMILDFLRSAHRSTFTMVAGKPTSSFFDLDDFLLGWANDVHYQPLRAQQRRAWWAREMASQILSLAAKHSVSRLVFIEKPDAGPVGALTLMDALLTLTNMEGCIVRPGKRLHLASIKGRPVQPGERLMIVNDVATTGSTISLAARRLRQLGGGPKVAYVLFDRGEGAKEALEKEGVQLLSCMSPSVEAKALDELGLTG